MQRHTVRRLTVVKGRTKDEHCEGVNPIGNIVKMRTKPIKDINILDRYPCCKP